MAVKTQRQRKTSADQYGYECCCCFDIENKGGIKILISITISLIDPLSTKDREGRSRKRKIRNVLSNVCSFLFVGSTEGIVDVCKQSCVSVCNIRVNNRRNARSRFCNIYPQICTNGIQCHASYSSTSNRCDCA